MRLIASPQQPPSLVARCATIALLIGCLLNTGCNATHPGGRPFGPPVAYTSSEKPSPAHIDLEANRPFSSHGIPFDDELAIGATVSWLDSGPSGIDPRTLLVVNHFPTSQGIVCAWSDDGPAWSVSGLGLIQQAYGCYIAPTGNRQLLIMCNPARGTGFGEGLFVLLDVPLRGAPRELARGPRFTRSHPFEKEVEIGMPLAIDAGTPNSRIIIPVVHVSADPDSNYDVGKASFRQEFLELAWKPAASRYERVNQASVLPLASNADLQWVGEYAQVAHTTEKPSR